MSHVMYIHDFNIYMQYVMFVFLNSALYFSWWSNNSVNNCISVVSTVWSSYLGFPFNYYTCSVSVKHRTWFVRTFV